MPIDAFPDVSPHGSKLTSLTIVRHVGRFMKRFRLILVIAAVVLYGLDFLSLELGIPRRDKLSSITVHTYYNVKLKSGKFEYDYAGDHQEDCANSIFPQIGLKPCWYLARHTNQEITIDSGDPNNPHIF